MPSPSIALTAELDAALSAAITLAKQLGHAEVREDHVLAALLFDEYLEATIGRTRDLGRLRALLEERLVPLESYRSSGVVAPSWSPAIEQTLRAAARGPLGIRSFLGLRVTTLMLFDALIARADAAIAEAAEAPHTPTITQLDMMSVFLEPSAHDADRLVEWCLSFGVSRARATFAVHVALARGAALVAELPPDIARSAHEAVKVAARAVGLPSPFTLLRGPDFVHIARAAGDYGMDVRGVIGRADALARERGSAVVGVAHVAVALIEVDAVHEMLVDAGVDVHGLVETFAGMVARIPEPELVGTPAPVLDDDVDVLLGTARIYGTERIRVPQLFAALFHHREARVLLEAHGARRGLMLTSLVGSLPEEEEGPIADDDPVEVVFHNDDFTTQEMVVGLLVRVFGLGEEAARERMLQVHEEGRGVVRSHVPARDARLDVARAIGIARAADMPLRITLRRRSSSPARG